jgi:hypothetical protein
LLRDINNRKVKKASLEKIIFQKKGEFMAGIMFPQALLLGGELLLIGFFLFVILYILIRLLTERHEHHRQKTDEEDKEGEEPRDLP